MNHTLGTGFAPSDVGRMLNYPVLRLGSGTLTLLVLVKVGLWILGVLLVHNLIRRLLLQRLLAHTHLDAGVRFAITRIFGYGFLTLGFYVALAVNGVDLSSLAVVAGALGIGVGFGLQNIVANFVSGLVLLVERPIALGDRIEVAGVAGNVTKISLRSTVVVTNDNISIIVPNSDLTSHPITNWSYGDPRVRVRVAVGVAYGTDPEQLRRALLEVAAAEPQVLVQPAPAVYFANFGDSSLNFELAVWTESMSHSPRGFRSDLNFAIERKLRQLGIEIPFPQRVVHLRPAPSPAGGASEAGPDR
jgi:small-conductance mechanosensitive channel